MEIVKHLYLTQKYLGKRIAKSFALRFEELGGKIIDETIYLKILNHRKINISVKNLLKIQDSINRKKRFKIF